MPKMPSSVVIIDTDKNAHTDLLQTLTQAGFTVHVTNHPQSAVFDDLQHCGCIITELASPEWGEIDVLSLLADHPWPRWPVIVLTATATVPLAVRAMKAGAFDFLQKPHPAEQVLASVRAACQKYHSEAEQHSAVTAARHALGSLTRRERDVMELLVFGLQNKAIAIKLGISARTVEFHRARVMEKTATDNLSELIRLSLRASP